MEFKGTTGESKVEGHSVYGNHFESSIACLNESLYSINSKELNANAKLIAAAPELLEALNELNQSIDDFWNGKRNDNHIKYINSIQQKSLKAIEKALK